MNAGLYGRSRTAGMSEGERINRRNPMGHALPPEDAIERAMEKVKVFARMRLVVKPRIAELPAFQQWDAHPEYATLDEMLDEAIAE